MFILFSLPPSGLRFFLRVLRCREAHYIARSHSGHLIQHFGRTLFGPRGCVKTTFLGLWLSGGWGCISPSIWVILAEDRHSLSFIPGWPCYRRWCVTPSKHFWFRNQGSIRTCHLRVTLLERGSGMTTWSPWRISLTWWHVTRAFSYTDTSYT